MKFGGEHYRTIWFEEGTVYLINQTLLPFDFRIYEAKNHQETCYAIKNMIVRGDPAIGAAAGYAMAQAFLEAPGASFSSFLADAKKEIERTRPTAQNLFYAANRVYSRAIHHNSPKVAAVREAQQIANEDVENCRQIGELGSRLIEDDARVVTHCNAGWLACVDYGTALAPVFVAHQNAKKVFVYVSETRPRSQGGKLTAWELKNEDIPYCIFVDSASAYIMSEEQIDAVIVGADRIARNGDVANKIGTLDKAIIAKEFGIPLYVAAPTSTIDLNCTSGKQITIEHRTEREVLCQTGLNHNKKLETIFIYPEDSRVTNPAFDVTPAKYVTGIITEKGIVKPDEVDRLLSGT